MSSLIKRIKNTVNKNYYLRLVFKRFIRRSHVKFDNMGYGKSIRDVIGNNNTIIIGKGTFLNNTKFFIRGNNNHIIIHDNCYVGPGCSFCIEGDNATIEIGKGCTFTKKCHLNAQENNRRIVLGGGCMLSNNIIIRTSDSHPIFDLATRERINPAGDVIICENVWIAPQSIISKGVMIGGGSIIGMRTLVTKDIPANVLAVGQPARVAKTGIMWSRDSLF